MIYLISTDSHKDSINIEYYFNESVRNVKVNFEDLKVTFETSWINNEDWEDETYYLFKVNQYENS